MQDQPNFVSSPFDAIRHVDGDREFWMARELSKLLGYSQWKNFEQVIAKAKIACEFNGHAVTFMCGLSNNAKHPSNAQ